MPKIENVASFDLFSFFLIQSKIRFVNLLFELKRWVNSWGWGLCVANSQAVFKKTNSVADLLASNHIERINSKEKLTIHDFCYRAFDIKTVLNKTIL